MDESSTRKTSQQIMSDADAALFVEVDPDRKFNRLLTFDAARIAKGRKLKTIRAIDVSTAKGVAAKEYFQGMLDRVVGGIEGNCLVIFGRTGAGKSHIIRQLVAHPDLQPRETVEGKYRPLLKLVAPAPCTLRTLGLRILQELGYRPKKKLREDEVWDRVFANLRAQGVAILVIDEMHNVLAGRNSPEKTKIAATLKSLMVSEDNPIQLVMAGLDPLKDFIKKYSELHRRAHFLELAPLEAVKDLVKYTKFLTKVQERLGVQTCGFTRGDMPQRFYFASRGLVGRMAYFAQEAATIAVSRDDEIVTEEHLAEAYRRPYGVGRTENPFLVLNVSTLKMPKQAEAIVNDDETLLRGTKKGADVEQAEIDL
ncbi:TniB family NTP-binding protein [Bradyrhizobium yuanmingense]|uniref:TniB family NTP-binding protein n=1 Tax=Bradyrhizobium yuanmingense TaxID=108015 RepID=UPI0012F881F8|nr:TniB family NTP-binding protein [Bradyrhizobium yuanmingense]